MIYAFADKERCASSQSRTVRWIVSELQVPRRLEVRLVQEANINAVLSRELSLFRLPVANIVSISSGQPQVFPGFS